jgi:hypothetical protein
MLWPEAMLSGRAACIPATTVVTEESVMSALTTRSSQATCSESN